MPTKKLISPVWRLADSLTIIEAALILVDVEPQGTSEFVEHWEDHQKPDSYLAARSAIEGALLKGSLQGKLIYHSEENFLNGDQTQTDRCNFSLSRVEVDSLTDWLFSRGWAEGYFFPILKKSGFRNKNHPRYAPKLAATVEAWEAIDEIESFAGTPKQRLMKWLRLNASRYGFTKEDGSPSENVLEELAKVANWSPGGGAPKAKPEPEDTTREDFSIDLDDDIPF